MKTKAEDKLDKAFKGIGVKPRVFYFTEDIFPFRAVTLATEKKMTWKEGKALLDDLIGSFFLAYPFDGLKKQPASKIKKAFEKRGYGVAICDKSDNFSRKEGRNRARGRLFKHIIAPFRMREEKDDHKM